VSEIKPSMKEAMTNWLDKKNPAIKEWLPVCKLLSSDDAIRSLCVKLAEDYEAKKIPEIELMASLSTISGKTLDELEKILSEVVNGQSQMSTPAILSIGECLINNYSKDVSKIIGAKEYSGKLFYKIRSFSSGIAKDIPFDYIPYEFSVTKCPDSNFPPRPNLKVGDCAVYLYTRKGKSMSEKGTIISIEGDDVTLRLDVSKFGVYGTSYHDIYELTPCK